MKYLYLEGHYEDSAIKTKDVRSDFIFKFAYNFFKDTKHKEINDFARYLYYLPYELNQKYSYFSLQTNDYIQASYFRENYSCVNLSVDSSFATDTGKKITVMFILFPDELEISKRKLNIKLYSQKTKEELVNIELTKPLSLLMFKARKVGYEIPKHDFPFIIMFYYIHGPIDKSNFSA